MKESALTIYLPTNLREFLAILEGLRISTSPGRSLEHLTPRPIVQPPLRAVEIELLTSGRDGDFPILLEAIAKNSADAHEQQQEAIPLSDVKRAVFRSDKEQQVVVNRRLDNVPVDLLRLDVDPSLFGVDGDSRYVATSAADSASSERWKSADQLGGAVAGLVAAADVHPNVREHLSAFLAGSLPSFSLDDIFGEDTQTFCRAAVGVIRQHHDGQGQDGNILLEELVVALGKAGMPSDEVRAFGTRMASILSSDEVRKRGSLSDKKNVLLRALSLLVQRPSLNEILADRVAGELPGPQVLLIAATLAGLRDGLARLSSERKSRHADALGQITAGVENEAMDVERLREMISKALAHDIPGRSSKAQTRPSNLVVLEICPFSKPAIVRRALADIALMPPTWRLILSDDNTLCLQIDGAGEDDVVAAKLKRMEWSKRPGKPRKTQTAKSMAPVNDEAMLPGLIGAGASGTAD